MEVYQIFCRDNMHPTGISVLNVAGNCKETIIKWWSESGRENILPMIAIKGIDSNISEWEAYA